MKKLISHALAFFLIFNSLFAFAQDFNELTMQFNNKQYEKAITLADEILKEDNSNMKALFVKADSFFELGKIKAAYDTYKIILEKNPKNEIALYSGARCLALLDDGSEAVKLLKTLISQNPEIKGKILNDENFHNIKSLDSFKKLMGINVFFGGKLLDLDVLPVNVEGRVLIPLRAIFEEFDASFSYDEATKTITVTKEGLSIKLTIGDRVSYINGVEKLLDVPAQIVDGRTLVPVRFISETLGAKVLWDDKNKIIDILTPANHGNLSYESEKAEIDKHVVVLPVSGAKINPFPLDEKEGMCQIVFTTEEGFEKFKDLSLQGKINYVISKIYENYSQIKSANPVYAKVIYNERSYFEGTYLIDRPSEIYLTYYEKGKVTNVVRQMDENYKDYYVTEVIKDDGEKENEKDKDDSQKEIAKQTGENENENENEETVPVEEEAQPEELSYSVIKNEGEPIRLVSDKGDWEIVLPEGFTEFSNFPLYYSAFNQQTFENISIRMAPLESKNNLKEIVADLMNESLEENEFMKVNIIKDISDETLNGQNFVCYVASIENSWFNITFYNHAYCTIYDNYIFEIMISTGNESLPDEYLANLFILKK